MNRITTWLSLFSSKKTPDIYSHINAINTQPNQLLKRMRWFLLGASIMGIGFVQASECNLVSTSLIAGKTICRCHLAPAIPTVTASYVALIETGGFVFDSGNASPVSAATIGGPEWLTYTNTSSSLPNKSQYRCYWNGRKFTFAEFLGPKPHPTTQPTIVGITNLDAHTQKMTWHDPADNNADHYLLQCDTDSTFSHTLNPSDGIMVSDDALCADGSGTKNIARGIQTATWSNLNSNTTYYYRIFAYANQGANAYYLTPSPTPTNKTTPNDSSTSIPTLSQWAQYVLMILLALIGTREYRLRKLSKKVKN